MRLYNPPEAGGGGGGYTTEEVQDDVGAMVDATLVYSDVTPSLGRAAITGDATIAAGSNASVLATVNANVGSFGGAGKTLTATANAKGLITAIAETAIAITGSQVSDFSEVVDDRVGSLLVAGNNVTLTYNDGANTLTVDVNTTTVADTTSATCSVALFESATGALAPKTDAGLTYNATTGVLTATGFAGPLTGNVTGNASGSSGSCTGNAATATALATPRAIGGVNFDGSAAIVPATITVADTTDTTSYIALFESATGDLAPKTDGGATYNATTGMVTFTGITGPLTGNASTATALANARTIGGTSFDGTANIVPATITVADTTDTTSYIALFESATGDLGPKTDGGATYNATTGMVTFTGITGPLTGNASTATALATPRTIGGTSFDGTANIVPATITVADTTDTTSSFALFESATGDLAPKTDAGATYNATTGAASFTSVNGATATEMSYLSGVTSAIQTQLNAVASSAGKQTYWIPANGMTPSTTSGAAPAQVEAASGVNVEVLDFGATADEYACFNIAFPKQWNEGTVTFQVFWMSTAADTDGVAWGLEGVSLTDNVALNTAFGTAVVVTDDAQGATTEVYVTAESGAVTIGSTPIADDLCAFRIFRDVSDANDDMTEDARLIGIKLFFTTDAATDA